MNAASSDRRQCAVIGLGSIGSGVIQTIAESGRRVVAIDDDAEARATLATRIRQSLTAQRLMRKGGTADPDEILARIDISSDIARVAHSSIIVENITEDLSRKRRLYEALDEASDPDAILIANTSCIPISSIADWISRKDRVIGVHFMNPVPLMTTAELIVAENTSAETVATVTGFLREIGKRAIPVKDAAGFVINRLLMPFINGAIQLLERDMAPPAAIDQIFMGCLGHKMGPLATADLIGLDTVSRSLIVLRDELADPSYEPAKLLLEKIERGHLGRKTGRGFFQYGRSN